MRGAEAISPLADRPAKEHLGILIAKRLEMAAGSHSAPSLLFRAEAVCNQTKWRRAEKDLKTCSVTVPRSYFLLKA